VIRERPDVRHYVAASRPVDRSTSLWADQSIRFKGWNATRGWPDLMRRVSIHDLEQSMRLAFWTNQWTLPAATISELYRQRWQIELFFRWGFTPIPKYASLKYLRKLIQATSTLIYLTNSP
jgi:IS4 transposase